MDLTNVRGRSMPGANLSSATLSGFDLRGTDLSGADLHDADLSMIRSGMTTGWALLVVLGALVLSVVLGAIVGVAARYLRGMYASTDVREEMVAMYVTASLIVFLVAGVWRGLLFAVRNVLPVCAALAVAAGLIAIVSGTGRGVGALDALVFLAVAAVVVTLAVLARSVGSTGGRIVFAIVAIAGGLAGGAAGGGLVAAIVAVTAMLMARRREQSPLVSRTAAALASRHGTSFRNANLAGANLNGAKLVACDFRGANLEGAHIDRKHATLCRFDKEPS
jgi:hypothetical protein